MKVLLLSNARGAGDPAERMPEGVDPQHLIRAIPA